MKYTLGLLETNDRMMQMVMKQNDLGSEDVLEAYREVLDQKGAR